MRAGRGGGVRFALCTDKPPVLQATTTSNRKTEMEFSGYFGKTERPPESTPGRGSCATVSF